MTIAVGSVTTLPLATRSTSTDIGFTHTVPTRADRLLLVGIAFNPNAPLSVTVNTVKWGAQSLTKLDSEDRVNATTDSVRVELWYLKAPNIGTNEITIDLAATPDTTTFSTAFAVNLTGVDQLTTFGTHAKTDGTNNSPSVNVSSASGEVVVDIVAQNPSDGIPNLTVGAGQTQLSNVTGSSFTAAMSYEAGASSVTMSWSSDSSAASHLWAIIAVPIKPSSATSGPLDSTTTVGEVSVVPVRGAPRFSPTDNVAEINQGYWEASGLFPKVLVGQVRGDEIVWDDVWTVPSVAPAGKLAVTSLPAPNSPDGSLIVTTQDLVIQYPLPYTNEPSLTEYPELVTDLGNDLLPRFYPSAVDFGTGLYRLHFVECVGQNFEPETDSWGFSFHWDETNQWSTVQWLAQGNALFAVPDENRGTVLHTAFSIHDGAATEPVGPAGRMIVAWVEKLDDHPSTRQQESRATPEKS